MRKIKLHLIGCLWIIITATWLTISSDALANPLEQQPTVNIPTVTGSPSGPIAVVNSDQDQINVRSGPSVYYPIVGVLVAGERVPAFGRSPGGDWVLVEYPGVPGGRAWVYSFLITLQGSLPIVEPPPTPTPMVTGTSATPTSTTTTMSTPAITWSSAKTGARPSRRVTRTWT